MAGGLTLYIHNWYNWGHNGIQWPFQDPKLEVPTIYKAYFWGLCKGISQQFIWPYMVQYLHFRILEFPLMYPPLLDLQPILMTENHRLSWWLDLRLDWQPGCAFDPKEPWCWYLKTYKSWGPRPRNRVQLVQITPITMVYGTQITIVTGAYKPAYNWGTSHCT